MRLLNFLAMQIERELLSHCKCELPCAVMQGCCFVVQCSMTQAVGWVRLLVIRSFHAMQFTLRESFFVIASGSFAEARFF